MTQDDEPGRTPEPSSEDHGRAKSWVALIFVLVLAGIAVFVVNEIIKQVNVQNCIFSGRRDCLQMENSGTPR